MARNREADLAIGEDSFLDTVANLVGVLIILVVIMAARTYKEARELGEKQRQSASKTLENPAKQMAAIRNSVAEQEQKLARHSLELQYRLAERSNLLQRIALTQEDLKKQMESVDEQVRRRVEQDSELEKLNEKLKELGNRQDIVGESDEPPIALQHLPTPMAKTVFGQEMHLYMSEGRVIVIPWDSLVDQLKQAAPLAAGRGSSRNVIEDSIGPIGGFLMRYRLLTSRRMTQAGGQVGMGSYVELERFELELVDRSLGESIEDALQTGSRLRVELAGRLPRETVITVWVYPDSFEAYRRLKEALFEEGFLTAARPLPEGVLVGASPRGSRSSAQ